MAVSVEVLVSSDPVSSEVVMADSFEEADRHLLDLGFRRIGGSLTAALYSHRGSGCAATVTETEAVRETKSWAFLTTHVAERQAQLAAPK